MSFFSRGFAILTLLKKNTKANLLERKSGFLYHIKSFLFFFSSSVDLLEGIFSLWMAKGKEAMDVKKAFDVRVRQLMQSRVENKVNKSRQMVCI